MPVRTVIGVVLGCAAASTLALALQQQVVGGHALDANLRVDGSGFNTASPRNRVSGLQSNTYRPSRVTSSPGLTSSVYSPNRATGGYSFSTGGGTYSTSAGRVDPMRNPQYSVLQTGAVVQRGTIPGGSAYSTRGLTTPMPATTVYRVGGPSVPPTGLTSTTYSVARSR